MRKDLAAVVTNLAILTLGMLPLWLGMFWLIGGLLTGFGEGSVWDLLQAFLFQYLAVILPLLTAGLTHQVFCIGIRRVIDARRAEWISRGTVAVIPVIMILVYIPIGTFLKPLVATITVVITVVYAVLLRVPSA